MKSKYDITLLEFGLLVIFTIPHYNSQLVSGRNSTNPAIRLVPGAGGIFSSGPLTTAGGIRRVDLFS